MTAGSITVYTSLVSWAVVRPQCPAPGHCADAMPGLLLFLPPDDKNNIRPIINDKFKPFTDYLNQQKNNVCEPRLLLEVLP